MKIVYVAKHGKHDNMDEDAIGWSLEQLGHEVIRIDERHAGVITKEAGDIILFHKWSNLGVMRKCELPMFSWFFDLVDGTHDPMLRARSLARIEWAEQIGRLTCLGFFTDGDWVARNPKERRHLLQGADERVAGYGTPTQNVPEILFLGMTSHGTKRGEHVRHLEERWGDRFASMGGGTRSRVHGRQLANVLASTKIVIAPNGPNTDLYWSNRVYLITSLGGFLLHPYCAGLAGQYPLNLQFYTDIEDCDRLIDHYLNNELGRQLTRKIVYEHTLAHHTYKHRCAELIKEIEGAL